MIYVVVFNSRSKTYKVVGVARSKIVTMHEVPSGTRVSLEGKPYVTTCDRLTVLASILSTGADTYQGSYSHARNRINKLEEG